jgi:hypothetical protein
MKIEIQLKETSQKIEHEDARNTYQKGSFYCVYDDHIVGGKVYKYPIGNIWRIIEDYVDGSSGEE